MAIGLSRLHCDSESFKMDLILDVNTQVQFKNFHIHVDVNTQVQFKNFQVQFMWIQKERSLTEYLSFTVTVNHSKWI